MHMGEAPFRHLTSFPFLLFLSTTPFYSPRKQRSEWSPTSTHDWDPAPERVGDGGCYSGRSQNSYGAALQWSLGVLKEETSGGLKARGLGGYLLGKGLLSCRSHVTIHSFIHSILSLRTCNLLSTALHAENKSRHGMTAATEFAVYEDKTHYPNNSLMYL